MNICEMCGIEYSPKAHGELGKKQKFCSCKCAGKNIRGDKHYLFGKKMPEETRIKDSESNKGKRRSPKTEFKIGDGYKGGRKNALRKYRISDKGRICINKRRELGSECLNSPNVGLEGHHINIEQIIYIPKEINHFCYHNVRTGKNMGIINYLALLWLITSGEINNCKV